jgi:hypothetical protein
MATRVRRAHDPHRLAISVQRIRRHDEISFGEDRCRLGGDAIRQVARSDRKQLACSDASSAELRTEIDQVDRMVDGGSDRRVRVTRRDEPA